MAGAAWSVASMAAPWMGVSAGAGAAMAGGGCGSVRSATTTAGKGRKNEVSAFRSQRDGYDELGEFREEPIPAGEKAVFGTLAVAGLAGTVMVLGVIAQQLLGGSAGEYRVFDESVEVVKGDEGAKKLLGEPISGAGGHPDGHRSQRQHVEHAKLRYEDGREGLLVVWYATGTRARALVRSIALANESGGYDLREVQLQEMAGKSRRKTWGTYTIKM